MDDKIIAEFTGALGGPDAVVTDDATLTESGPTARRQLASAAKTSKTSPATSPRRHPSRSARPLVLPGSPASGGDFRLVVDFVSGVHQRPLVALE
jgi:hypothetical protein